MAGNVREMKFWITLLFLQGLVCVSTQHGVVRPTQAPVFELVEALDHPVIGVSEGKSMHGINHGFEGGLYFKTDDGMHHLFPSECMQDMKNRAWDIHMESHHWFSQDGINNWTQGALIYNSSAKIDGSDRRAAIWAPVPIFNPDEDRWNLFYVGYTCNPGQSDGAIFRIVSATHGKAGLSGPYPPENATMILNREGLGGPSEPWEGYQGTDSFHAWQLDNGTWMGFYGSHDHTKEWRVGLITANTLAGPWTRTPWLNPATYIETPEGIENPIVTRLTDKSYYVAVYDALLHGTTVGITYSADGVHWNKAQYVDVNSSHSSCGTSGMEGIRTPQGLVPEPTRCAGCYSMLYTGNQDGYENECWVLLRNTAEANG